MEATLIIIGIILLIVGLIGCVIPALPGPPIAYIALILLEFSETPPFSFNFMFILGLIVILVTALDFYVPAWGTKKFGGSKYGSWGSIVGLIIGLFIPPFGIIIGPFLGAVVGELIYGMESKGALRAGFGAFIGFLAGTIMKIGVTLTIGYFFIKESWVIISAWL